MTRRMHPHPDWRACAFLASGCSCAWLSGIGCQLIAGVDSIRFVPADDDAAVADSGAEITGEHASSTDGPSDGDRAADVELDGDASTDAADAGACPGAQYDWSDFPGNYDSVGSSQIFYMSHFGVPGVALCSYATSGTCQTCWACEMWVGNAASPSEWDRYANGTGTPRLFDMIVYPPNGTGFAGQYGHIGIVDHADSMGVYVMDTNYVGPNQKAPCPHVVSWAPYGYYRLKSLEAPPPG